MRKLTVAGIGTVGTVAFGLWLERLGVSDHGLIVTYVVCAIIVAALTWKAPSEADVLAARLSWRDLESRFDALFHRDARVNAGTGNPVHAFESSWAEERHGTHWAIGGNDREITKEARDLCTTAGRKLKKDGLATLPRLVRITSDSDRWLWYLVEIGETTADERYIGTSGSEPTRYTYHFNMLLPACVNGCRKLLINEV